ncbi:hypothetical protein EBZ37_01005 [bacterium]|nr:hypothetical protein [bacterium]
MKRGFPLFSLGVDSSSCAFLGALSLLVFSSSGFADTQSHQESAEALQQLRGFSSTQKILAPASSCSIQQDSDDETVLDYSEESCSQLPRANSPMRLATRLAARLKALPGPVGGYLSKLVQDYEQVLRPQNYGHQNVADGNFGLASYLVEQFKSDPELMQSALGFYSEISKRDQRTPPTRRPTIQDRVSPEEEGWVWKLALQYSNHDPLKAMRMIGLCGHDDVYQLGDDSLEGQPFNEAEKQAEFQARVRDLQQQIGFLKSEMAKLGARRHLGSSERTRLLEMKVDLTNFQSQLKSLQSGGPQAITLRHQFFCPAKDSSFYLPGGLGVDISDTMRSRIARDQKPDVAAKYYHVYGAALVACELVRRGHSPVLVAQLQKLLGWAYRAQRFNTEACSLARKSEEYRKTWGEEEALSESEHTEMDAAELMRRWAFNTDNGLARKIALFPFQTNFRVVVPKWIEGYPVVGKLLGQL